MLEAVQESLVEVLRVVVTVTESQNKCEGFYEKMLIFLDSPNLT